MDAKDDNFACTGLTDSWYEGLLSEVVGDCSRAPNAVASPFKQSSSGGPKLEYRRKFSDVEPGQCSSDAESEVNDNQSESRSHDSDDSR